VSVALSTTLLYTVQANRIKAGQNTHIYVQNIGAHILYPSRQCTVEYCIVGQKLLVSFYALPKTKTNKTCGWTQILFRQTHSAIFSTYIVYIH